MKISEIKNAPQWLLDADTKDADVDIIDGVVIWHSGTWKSGIWCSGVWKRGVWKRGIWQRGTWQNGVWEGGVWKRGVWESGTQSAIRAMYIPLITNEGQIAVGCKTKSPEEWKKWLDSDEEYNTKRSDKEFASISMAIKIAIFSCELMKEN